MKRQRNLMTTITRTSPGLRFPALPLVILPALSVLAVATGKAQNSASATKSAAESSDHALGSGRVVLYAGVGPELMQYDVDVENAALIKRGSVLLPGNVQYAWPQPSRRYFYVAWSTGGPPTAGVSSAAGGTV